MHRFKPGQKVVAINDAAGGIKKGDIVHVESLACCPGCGQACVYLTGYTKVGFSAHKRCGWEQKSVRHMYAENTFQPLEAAENYATYREKAFIPQKVKEELTIKELQSQ